MSAASRACHPPMSPSALQKPCTLASNTSSPAKLILHNPQQARKMNGSCCAYILRCQPLSATCCFPSPTTFNGAWERHGMSQIPKQRVYSKPDRTSTYPTYTYVHIPCTLMHISHTHLCTYPIMGYGVNSSLHKQVLKLFYFIKNIFNYFL